MPNCRLPLQCSWPLPKPSRVTLFVVGLALALPIVATAQATSGECGSLANGYGPFDFRSQKSALEVVERFHFTPAVESLRGGASGYIGGDLDYTLRASPNHHRALVSMMRLGEQLKMPKVPHANYSVECYFDRAIRFRPDDVTVRMLYASYLGRQGRKQNALSQLDEVVKLGSESPFTQYNAGMIYFELQEFDRALQQAHIAMAQGFARPQLRSLLVNAGKWREPDAQGAATSGTPTAGASAPR